MTIIRHRSVLQAGADAVPELSADARHALLAAIYCDLVTGIYQAGQDFYIDGAVDGKDFWLTPAEWERDYKRLLGQKDTAA